MILIKFVSCNNLNNTLDNNTQTGHYQNLRLIQVQNRTHLHCMYQDLKLNVLGFGK